MLRFIIAGAPRLAASWRRVGRYPIVDGLGGMGLANKWFRREAEDMILVCGEALVDLFILGEHGPRLAAEAVAGGSPFNVAIGLARLGCPAALCTGLSTDRFGRLLTDLLNAEGVNLDYALRTPRLTTISVVATDREGHP